MQLTANSTDQGQGKVKAFIIAFARNLYSWGWTKSLVYWLILSAGTASDLVFLFASLWMSVSANVHDFILQFMSEREATNITYLATTAYVALPIFIVGLAVVQTIGHVKMWKTGGLWSRLWTILFGIPAIVFLVMDFVTISCSVVNVTFTMPGFFVVLRADSAFIFAFGSLIYFFLGKPQERERLAEKDSLIAGLQAELKSEIARLSQEKEDAINGIQARLIPEITRLNQEMSRLKSEHQREIDRLTAEYEGEITLLSNDLDRSRTQETMLLQAVNKSRESSLQGYSQECIDWLMSGIKSASVAEIKQYTGLTTAKINNAIAPGKLRTTPNNKALITISSLVEWLKVTPAPVASKEPVTGPMPAIVAAD